MIAAIEDAIKARLAGARLPYLRTVATYSGQFDEDLSLVVRAFPAAWVVFKSDGPGRATSTSRGTYHMPATFLVMVGARNLRCEEAARKGGPSAWEVGSYQMLVDVRALLLGQDFGGMEISPLAPGRTSVLINGKIKAAALSILGQEWHTTYPLRVPRLREGADVLAPGLPPTGLVAGDPVPGGSGHVRLPVLPNLERMGINYHLLPDDGQPDALDLVTLQEGREA